MQKNWNEVFFKILEEPSIVQKKNDTSYKRARFFTEMKQKKIQNGRLRKFKMAASKKPRFPAPPILNIFSWNFYGLVLGLVELIDAKGIEMSQLIWSWGCPTNNLKTQKTHFLSVFELMSDSLTTIKVEPHQCLSHQSILLTQGPNHKKFMKKYWESRQ